MKKLIRAHNQDGLSAIQILIAIVIGSLVLSILASAFAFGVESGMNRIDGKRPVYITQIPPGTQFNVVSVYVDSDGTRYLIAKTNTKSVPWLIETVNAVTNGFYIADGIRIIPIIK